MKNCVTVITKNKCGYTDEAGILSFVEEAFLSYLDSAYCTSEIGELFKPGCKIVIKPNLVHNLNFKVLFDGEVMENPNDCFITNWSVIRGVVKFLSQVDGLDITILECPLQSCNIENIITSKRLDELSEFNQNNQIHFVDGRRTRYIFTDKEPVVYHGLRGKEFYTDFDLADLSEHKLYEKHVNRFRVTDYPPMAMKEFHSVGKHKYRIANEIVEADIIINIPKLKTHMKAGMTCAMKNFVGIVGNKECLPHHIKGTRYFGGDCYGDISLLKILAENVMDYANSFLIKDEKKYIRIKRIVDNLLRIRKIVGLDNDITGSWYGNDTICRTIVDLNRIIYYGGKDGRIHDKQQRKVLTLVDGIVTGQGDGPMKPSPNFTGFFAISESTAALDLVCSKLIGLNPYKIRYLQKKRICTKICNLCVPYRKIKIFINGFPVGFDEIQPITSSIQAPYRWKGRIEIPEGKNKFSYMREWFYNLKNYPAYIKKLYSKNEKRSFS